MFRTVNKLNGLKNADINYKSNFVIYVLADWDVISFVYEVPSKLNHCQNIITKCDGIITNCDSLVYYKVRWTVITNCDSFFITKCDTVYYKLRQVLQSTMNLLQIATGITKCDDYYKLRQYSERFVDQCRAKTILSPLYFKILSIVSVQQ